MKLTKAQLVEKIMSMNPQSESRLRRRKLSELAAELRKLERLPVAMFAPPVAKVAPPIRRPEPMPEPRWPLMVLAVAFRLTGAILQAACVGR